MSAGRRRLAVGVAVCALGGWAPLASGAVADDLPPSAGDDTALAASAVELEAFIDDHLWYGQIAGATFGTAEKEAGDVVGLHGTGDSAIWTGHYLASQAYRYATARDGGDDGERAAARARIDDITEAFHRNINISAYWLPAQECDADTLPTLNHGSCGLPVGEAGALLRNCFPAGFPFQDQDPATRHRQIFGPIRWEDGTDWFCEDGTSRDQYAGVTFGLLATLEMVGPDDPVLARTIAEDLMAMTGYLVRHGWSVVRPHTTVETEGSENFVFPLFVYVPSARLNMATAARYAAHAAGTLDEQATWDAVWSEELATQTEAEGIELLLAIQSPHTSYYTFNLDHLTNYDIMRYSPSAATRAEQARQFAVLDASTRDDLNAHFETLTYGLTGERWRHDLAVQHLREWLDYRAMADDGGGASLGGGCGADFLCVPRDQVTYFVDTPSGPQGTVQPGSSTEQRAAYPLPVRERVRHHDFLWQRSPYELRASQPADPITREPGVDFLLPYWMLRYFEEVDEPSLDPFPAWTGPRTEASPPGFTGRLDPAPAPPGGGSGALSHLVGAMHEHSGYSDGKPGSRPEDYFRSGRDLGLDFLAGSEHSDNDLVPFTTTEACLDPAVLLRCPRLSSDDEWVATGEQAANTTDASFTAVRGFEWSSDRFGHINVYWSRNQTFAKADGGYVAMPTFWDWFTRSAALGGGADGLATFNHPGAKQLVDADPTQNWDDFAYVPAADARMVGVEVFNDVDDFGSAGPPEGWYAHALDRGWHLGAVGAEDIGHRATDDWGGPTWPKTIVLATDRSPESLRAAMLARRFYAVRVDDGLRLEWTVGGAPMGARIVRPVGSPVVIVGRVNRPGTTLEVVTSSGQVVATSHAEAVATMRPATGSEAYYFLRVRDTDGEPIAYSSPVWVGAAAGSPVGEWLAGDLHVHTCYSHDAYCGAGDDNTGLDEAYTLSGSVEERFGEAAIRGLDYLAITDHNDIRSRTDPGFGAHGVVGVPGYEHSFDGHAQLLGVDHVYTGDSASVAAAVRADGGLFQINHPADGLTDPMDTCDETANLDWAAGYDVTPDSLEVWNIGHHLQPPAPAGNSNDDAERFWECFLTAGDRVAATGGSDSHWLSTSAFQGVGNPTTWVFAGHRSAGGVLGGIDAGRTSVSMLPPAEGGAPLLLEADTDGDGEYESFQGDTVEPGTPLRVRSLSPAAAGLVSVRATGTTIVADEPLLPGGAVTLVAPDEPGWVRAVLRVVAAPAGLGDACDALAFTSYCRNQLVVASLTSALYVERP